MKVLVLNGSPRRNGLVSQMLEHIAGNLPETCDVERIFVHDLLTGMERQVTFGPGSDEQPAFCADSYFIAFSSSRGGGRGIYLITRHGGDAKRVPTGGGNASFPRWGMPGVQK